MEQIIKARIVLAHVDADGQGEKIARPNELILYDFKKSLENNTNNKEIRLRIGDGETAIKNLSDLPLGNMHYYDSKPEAPEAGDVWYDKEEETFYLGIGPIYEEIKITSQEYQPNIYYKWLTDEGKYVLDSSTNWLESQTYYILKDSIKLSHVIENIEDGVGEGSIQTTNKSDAIGNYSSALGSENMSGAKAFSITGKDNQNNTYTLETVEGIAENDEFSIVLTKNYDFQGKIIGIDTTNNKVEVDNFIDEDIKAGSSYLLIPSKPTIGNMTIGTGALATGYGTKALGVGAHSEGYDTVAAGKYSHTEGRSTKAGYQGHAEGYNTYAGFGAHAENEKTKAQGKFSHAEGEETEAIGKTSHAEGYRTQAKENYSHAEGKETTANGLGSHAEGGSTKTKSPYAHAEGFGTVATAKDSGENDGPHAEGKRTGAAGSGAHSEGYSTSSLPESISDWNDSLNNVLFAKGTGAHAEGMNTKAQADASHTEGSSTKTTGVASHAEGSGTIASGTAAHAEGSSTRGEGANSHAEGTATIARGKSQHVQGEYNEPDPEANDNKTRGKYAHIVGNGTSQGRSNAHTLDWEGNAWYAGDITATGALKGSSVDVKTVNATNGKFNKIEVGSESQVIIDEDGVTSISGINSNNLNINNKATIDEYGNIWTNTDLKMGEKEIIGDYGQALRYRGKVKTTNEVNSPRTGDIVISEIDPNLEQDFLGFYIPEDKGFATTDFQVLSSMIDNTGNIINLGERTNTYIKALLYLANIDEYINSIPSDLIEVVNFKANTDVAPELFINFAFDTGRLLQFRVGTIVIQGKETVGADGEDKITISGSWITTPDDIYLNFPNNFDVLIYSSPSIENIDVTNHPEMEEFKKWQKNSENVFIYSEDEWIKVNSNNLSQLGNSVNGLLPIVGYEDFCAYKVSEEKDIIDCLNQAISENPFVQIWPGEYSSDRTWGVPDINDIKIKGIGEVTLDFSITPNLRNDYGINKRNVWYWENINLNKKICLTSLGLLNGGSYAIFGTAKNCNFKNKVSIDLSYGTSTSFEDCNFYDNIVFNIEYGNIFDSIINYKNCNFYIDTWTTPIIEQLYLTSLNGCNLYFNNDQKEIILGMSSSNFSSNNLKNNIYYLKGSETEFIPPHYIEGVKIQYSAFPWNSLKFSDRIPGGYYEIDLETCYVNNKPFEEKEELLIQDIDKDFIQNTSSLDKVTIEGIRKIEGYPTTIALVSGTENTPDGDETERYELWKENKDFSYLDQISGSFIQGGNHFIIGNSFVTGQRHLATGILHTIEGYGNSIGGFGDGIPDIQLRADHAEGMNNILPSEYGEPQFRFPMARHIEGFENIGNSVAGSHVQGYYCLKDENNKYIHIVGNGEDDENRSNAHTIDKSGNSWFAGGLTLTDEHYPVIHYRDENNTFPQDNLISGQMFVLSTFMDDLNEEITLTEEDSIINNTLKINVEKIREYLLSAFWYLFNTDTFVNYEITTIKPTLKLQISEEILEFKEISTINKDNNNNISINFSKLVITDLNGNESQSQNYTPDDNDEISLNGKVVKSLGIYNYLGEKYEAGLYLRTNDNADWKKLSIFTKNTNQDSPGSTPGGENPQNRLLIVKPTNGAYNFEINLSTYGIRLGDIINFVCIGAGGAGGGVSSTKKGGDAGSYGYSSSSSKGGTPGTGFGAGGGGSCANSTSSSYYGGSGGGSGYVVMGGPHTVDNLTVNVTLGKAGTGGSGAGGNGGDTIFLGITAKGGEGGNKGSTSKPTGGQGGKEGQAGSSGNISKSGGNGGNGWVPSNYNPDSDTISVYGAIASDNVPTYSGDGAIFIWY